MELKPSRCSLALGTTLQAVAPSRLARGYVPDVAFWFLSFCTWKFLGPMLTSTPSFHALPSGVTKLFLALFPPPFPSFSSPRLCRVMLIFGESRRKLCSVSRKQSSPFSSLLPYHVYQLPIPQQDDIRPGKCFHQAFSRSRTQPTDLPGFSQASRPQKPCCLCRGKLDVKQQ